MGWSTGWHEGGLATMAGILLKPIFSLTGKILLLCIVTAEMYFLAASVHVNCLFLFIIYLFIYVNILKLLLQSSSHCNNQTLDGSVCEYNGPFSLDYNGLLLQGLNSILVCV